VKPSRSRGLLPLILAAALVSGCGGPSALLSDAEKRTIYAVSFTDVAEKSINGASLEPGAEIALSMSQVSGVKSPEALSITLTDSKGIVLASLNLATANYVRGKSSATMVTGLSGTLPSFKLPSNLAPGIYTLVSVLLDKTGAELQSTKTSFFVGSQGMGLGSLSIYPPSPSKSSPVLLSVGVRGAEEAPAAWIRWTYEGRTIAEGPLAEGYDRTVWRTPSLEGAYALAAELFPEKPQAGLDMDSPWHQEIKAIVSDSSPLDNEEFSDKQHLLSHLSFDGDFVDTGTRVQERKPAAFGAPLLDSFPGGFGYILGDLTYIEIPGAVPPSSNGIRTPFSLVWRLYSLLPSGELVRFSMRDGSLLMRAGLENGHPFVETVTPEGAQRSTCEAVVPSGLSDLAVSFDPVDDEYSIVWSIEGIRHDAPPLPVGDFASSGIARLGGPGSLKGIYDEFAISDDSQGRPTFFRAAALRAWRSGLFIGEGFEGRSLPADTVAKGTVTAVPGSLTLEADSRLEFPKYLLLTRPLCIEATYEGIRSDMAVELSSGDGFRLMVNGAGEVVDAKGVVKGLLRPVEAGRLAFIVRTTPDGIEIVPEGGLPAAAISLAKPPDSLKIALCDTSDKGALKITTLLVRSAPDALSQADGPRAAALK